MDDDTPLLRPPKNGDIRTLKDGTKEMFWNGTWKKKKLTK